MTDGFSNWSVAGPDPSPGTTNTDAGPNPSAKRPKIKLPKGYKDESGFLAEMRELFYDDVQSDRLNRESALEDLRFYVGDQWDDLTRQRRESARKPCLTVNRLPAFVAQIVGNRRLNETQIKCVPDSNNEVASARIREGLIRNIQKVCRADSAYDKALEGAVICGLGNFQLALDYASDDVFDQEIKILPILDHLSVIWDRFLVDSSGADADHVFVVENMTKKEFYRRWPWATPADVMTDMTLRGDLRMNGWIAVNDVRVVSYWRMRKRKTILAMMQDGSVRELTDELEDGDELGVTPDVLARVAQRPDGTPIMREVMRPYAEMYICSGIDVLEGPFRLDISRLPVFRVAGWETSVGDWRHRWGLVRFLKDPQRLHNYWRSVVAERIMQTPRAVWVAGQSAVAGRENTWRQSHISDDPLLIYNDDAGQKPERVMPAQIENSLMQQAEVTAQDLKDVSNIHEANLGMPSNEVSGAAIMARQRVSDTGSIIYHDNLNNAIEQCGIVINELIPTVYDAPRIIKVLGTDNQTDLQKINDPNDPDAVDITSGKYSVSLITGPSFATKRMEALASMTSLANAAPQLISMFADLYVQAQDWPMAQEIARRIRMTLPPGVVDPKDMTPEEQQRAQGQQQSAQQQQQAQMQMLIAQWQKLQSEIAMNNARAGNYAAQAQSIPAREQTQAMSAASQAADRELRGHLEAIKVASGS